MLLFADFINARDTPVFSIFSGFFIVIIYKLFCFFEQFVNFILWNVLISEVLIASSVFVFFWNICGVPKFIWVHSCEQITIQDDLAILPMISTKIAHAFIVGHIFHKFDGLFSDR